MTGPAPTGEGFFSTWEPALPLLPGVIDLSRKGMVPGGTYRNKSAYSARVAVERQVDEMLELLLYDPQTSGGFLMAIDPAKTADFETRAAEKGCPAVRIGAFDDSGKVRLV